MAYKKIEFKNNILRQGVHYLTSDFKTRNSKRPTHGGIDVIGKGQATDDIIAIDYGTVVTSTYSNTAGYYVEIKHDNSYISRYLHMKKGSVTVKVGDKVEKGQVLGFMGNTGYTTDKEGNKKKVGTHLHFGVRDTKGTNIDPLPFLEGTQSFKKSDTTNDKGTYEVVSPRYVRTGPHTTYKIKKVSEITADGKKHVVNNKSTADAQYKKGTRFDVLEIAYAPNGAKWGHGYSGWICLVSSKGKVYCKKVK